MKIVIPCAGKGTRLRPLTLTRPKPLIRVAGATVLEHVLERFKIFNDTEYIFITGYLQEQMKDFVKEQGLKAQFCEQKVRDGTAGAINLCKPYVNEPLLICFVDTIFDADLSGIEGCEDDGIIWAHEVEDYQRFGVITEDGGYAKDIVEKPNEPISRLANIGLYYIKNHNLLFESIKYVFENDIRLKGEYYLTDALRHMIKKGARFQVRKAFHWYDCGKPETILSTNASILQHNIQSVTENTKFIEPVFVEEGCCIKNSMIGPNVSIHKGSVIHDASINNSVLEEKSKVSHASVSGSLIGAYTVLEQGEFRNILLGDYSKV